MYKKFESSVYDTKTSMIVRTNDDGSTTSFAEPSYCNEYQAYLKWLEEGNTPLPADEPTA
jgi:hypothetical protein